MNTTKTILLIEDNPAVLKANQRLFTMHNYHVLTAQSLAEAQAHIQISQPDLLVLDIMLPDGSGLEFCRNLRRTMSVPVLFLTALGTKSMVVKGLRTGGDDYLTKPYHMQELLARAETLLRRAAPQTIIERGPLRLDITAMRAFVNGEDAMLTPREFSVLHLLVTNEGNELSTERIYRSAWGQNATSDTRAVRTQISRLRTKLKMNEHDTFSISAERGKGYVFIILD